MAQSVTPKCVLLSDMFPPALGGSAVLFANLYSRIGLPVTVLTNSRPEMPAGFSYIPGVAIDPRHRGIVDRAAMRQHWNLTRVVRALAPAVVHCGRMLPEGIPATLATLTARGLPFAAWTHGEEINSALQSREHTWLMRRVHRHASLLLANSRNTRAVLESVGAEGSKIRVIYPGVDAERFEVRAQPRTDQGKVLLSVGRLQRRKGHDLVLRALPALLKRHSTLRYVIVGDGEERPRLESMARELAVTARVTFVGEVPDDLLPGYFAAADIFVLPNRVEKGDFEGFGIVFLEAAAAGLPTVGGRSGGVPEAVLEDETGLLVDGTDPAELEGALHRLLVDRVLARSLGEAGRRRVRNEFTWAASAARLREAHLELAARL